MNKYRLYFIAIATLFISQKIQAQTYTYSHGQEIKKSVVNFTELANYEKAHPQPLVRKPMFEEDEEESGHWQKPPMDPSLISMLRAEVTGSEHPHSAYLPVSPAPTDTFLSTNSDGTGIPPDTHGGVDATYCVTAINTAVHIQTRTGGNVSSVSLDHFWASVLPSGTGTFDPRVHYDPYAGRWIIVTDAVNNTTMESSTMLIGMSVTGDPTGSWYLYAIPLDASGASWLDFPNVGFNNRWITVTGNFFSNSSGGFANSAIYVFTKASIMGGTGAPYTKITDGGSMGGFSDCPAVTYDANEANMFIVDDYNGGSGQIRLRKISGTTASPVLSGTIYSPTSSTHWNYQGNSTGSNFAPQLGGGSSPAGLIQTNDDRINNLTFRNGKLWCSHNVFLPSSSPNRCSVMWWELDSVGGTGLGVQQNGLIDDATAANFYSFPSISVNANNDALIGYSNLSATIHPCAAYSLHMNTDAVNTLRPQFTFRHGTAAYILTASWGTSNRWGDYSGTTVDPTNDLDFWTIQEGTHTGGFPNWDCWWAYVRVCGYLATPTPAIIPAVQCQGTSAWYSVNPVAGATGYTWTITGTGWSGSSTTDSIFLTASPTAGTAVITAAANDTCGPGVQYVFTITPSAIPSETITPTAPICIGASTGTFTLTGTGSPTSYSWTVLGTGWSILGSTVGTSILAGIGTGTGTIIVNATNSCGTGPDDTLLYTPGTIPNDATAITAPAPYCSGSTVIFTEPAVTGATSYLWDVSGTGWSGSSTTNTISVTVGTGVGAIKVTPVNSCGDGASYTWGTIVPTTTPSVTLSVPVHVTTTHTNVSVYYTGSIYAGMTYAWATTGGGVFTPTPSSPSPVQVHWPAAGTYTVTLTVDNGGCSGSSSSAADTVHVNPTTAVPQVNVNTFEASIVPNPNDGMFNILFDQSVTRPVSVTIYDMQGRTVYFRDFGIINNNKLSVETDHLAAGNYNATINVDGAFITKKITISK